MSVFFTTIFSVLCTAILGTFITNKIAARFQKRSAVNSIELKRSEEKIKDISNINIRINKSSASRRFATINLINALIDNSPELDTIRKEYREEVKNWNVELTSYNIELAMFGLFDLAQTHLEGFPTEEKYSLGIHQNFVDAHNLINSYITDEIKNQNLLIRAKDILDITYKETKYISNKLNSKIEKIWTDLSNNNTSPLSINNLEQAETYKLIIAIFNPRSDLTRIK